MDACPDGISGNQRIVKRSAIILLSASILIFSSCTNRNAAVLTDPYIEAFQDGGLVGPMFGVRARLAGFRVMETFVDENTSPSAALESLPAEPDVIIFSPWAAGHWLKTFDGGGKRLVVAGGYPQENFHSEVEGVGPVRNRAMERLGILCAEMILGNDGVCYALFDAETEIKKTEMEIFSAAFRKTAGNDTGLIVEDMSRDSTEGLPGDFNDRIGEASIMAVFTGMTNVAALEASDEAGIPAVTAYLASSDAWSDRIAAHVEHNRRGMEKALIDQLGSGNAGGISHYEERLFRGKRSLLR